MPPQGWSVVPDQAPTPSGWTPVPEPTSPAMTFAIVNGQRVPTDEGVVQKGLEAVGNVAVGAAKGAGQSAFYAGKFFHSLPVVGPVLDAAAQAVGPEGTDPTTAFAKAPEEIQPHGLAQHVGSFLETLGEMYATGKVSAGVKAELTSALSPYLSKAASIVPRAVEGVSNAAQAAIHGGNALVGGVLGAALPGSAGALGDDAADALRASAEKNVAQAMGPTKERFKAIAASRAGEILDRGILGATGTSRQALLETARAHAADLGRQIGGVIQDNAGKTIPTSPILAAIDTAKAEFQHVVSAPGAAATEISFVPRAVKQLDGLKDILSQYGDTVRVDQAVAVRRAWDKIVADAGGYSHRAGSAFGVALNDASEAATKRTATSAIRDQLNQVVPSLQALNKEFSFWKDLQNVMASTKNRTQAQGPGLASRLIGGVAAAAGGAAGFQAAGPEAGVVGAFASKELAELAHSAFTSPRWAFIKASAKNELAESILSGNAQRVGVALGRILSFEGATAATAMAQK